MMQGKNVIFYILIGGSVFVSIMNHLLLKVNSARFIETEDSDESRTNVS